MKNLLHVARSLKGSGLRRSVLALGVCAAAFSALATAKPAQASPAQFDGYWINVNAATRGIVRFQIAGAPGAQSVHVYGACVPTACDWGLASLTTYGDSVVDADHHFGTAVYNTSFDNAMMTFQLTSPTTMVVQTFDKFTDGSGRQNYHSGELFRKLILWPLPLPIH